ncbi:6-carboxytetrahydropterin synthase [Levilactobacillus andaensis]|uniref:6-carboxytetrahydropterin synthase n=1 Tax=Levilactobacillus andaensis TaxID=2799570 RepID=UPI001F3A9460|nr:6-carboxytetrahydropterin synthase [Levilactobacillus andaensis]
MGEIHTYKIKSYINASHAMRWESGTGQKHNHTWEVITEIQLDTEHLVRFNDIEDDLKGVSARYSGQFLNEIPPFDKINPSLENITRYFYKELTAVLAKSQAKLMRLEVGESPTRFYCIQHTDD